MKGGWRSLACALLTIFAVGVASAPETASAQDAWQESWPEFRVSEGIATGVLFGGSAALQYGTEGPSVPKWSGGILLDDPVNRLIAAETERGAEAWNLTSDVLLYSLMGYPVLVDGLAVASGVDQNPRTSLQLQLTAVESFAATTLVTTAIKHIVARRRPYAADCPAGEGGGPECDEDRFKSFPSGHTSMSFTGASLICVFHESLDLYGGGLADRVPCWTAIGAATMAGVARIGAHKHYFSDIVVGAAIGFASGYILPKALHFGFGDGSEDGTSIERSTAGQQATLRPSMGEGFQGFSVTIPFR